MKKETVYLEIGGNIENRLHFLLNTRRLINLKVGNIIKTSSIYQSPPWGFTAENDFLNQTIKIETTLLPHQLIKATLEIEKQLHRTRSVGNYTSRTVDIDILFYGTKIINEENLIVPHPKMQLRKFVLLPLNEIAPDFVHPKLNKTINNLLNECTDDSICERL